MTLGWVFTIALLPDRHWRWQGISLAAAVLLTRVVRLGFRRLGQRVLGVLPFVALAALGQWGSEDWAARVAHLFAKAVLCLWAISLLVASLPFGALLCTLRRIGAPGLIVGLLGFWER